MSRAAHRYARERPAGRRASRLPPRERTPPIRREIYEVSVDDPAERLRGADHQPRRLRPVLSAVMDLRRREVTRRRMFGLLVRYPPMTLATLSRIYANALRLRLKGATYHPRPRLAAN